MPGSESGYESGRPSSRASRTNTTSEFFDAQSDSVSFSPESSPKGEDAVLAISGSYDQALTPSSNDDSEENLLGKSFQKIVESVPSFSSPLKVPSSGGEVELQSCSEGNTSTKRRVSRSLSPRRGANPRRRSSSAGVRSPKETSTPASKSESPLPLGDISLDFSADQFVDDVSTRSGGSSGDKDVKEPTVKSQELLPPALPIEPPTPLTDAEVKKREKEERRRKFLEENPNLANRGGKKNKGNKGKGKSLNADNAAVVSAVVSTVVPGVVSADEDSSAKSLDASRVVFHPIEEPLNAAKHLLSKGSGQLSRQTSFISDKSRSNLSEGRGASRTWSTFELFQSKLPKNANVPGGGNGSGGNDSVISRVTGMDGAESHQEGDLRSVMAMGGGSIKENHFPATSVQDLTVPNKVNLDHCYLNRASFKSVIFKERVQFVSCILDAAVFNKCTFEKGIRFDNCFIQRSTANLKFSFKDSTICSKFELRRTTLDCNTKFENCQFEDDYDGWDSKFQGWLDFENCTWEKNCDFRSATFQEGLVFKESAFNNDLMCRGTVVTRKLEFDECVLRGLLDIRKAKFHDFVYMQALNFTKTSTFRLWNCIAYFMLVEPKQIHGKLASTKEKDWRIAAEEYAILKKNFKSLAWLDEEDWSYYHFKKSRWRAQGKLKGLSCCQKINRQWSRLIELILYDLACGYGTKPAKVVSFSLWTITWFAFLYCIPIMVNGAPEYDDAEDVSVHLKTYRLFGNTFVDAVCTAFIASAAAYTSGFDGVDKNVEGWMAVAFVFEGLLGLMMLGLFIVSFSRKMIR